MNKVLIRKSRVLTEDKFGVYGDVSYIYGNLTGLRGCVTGIFGCATGIRGNLDECGLTDEDRERGVYIEDLVEDDIK